VPPKRRITKESILSGKNLPLKVIKYRKPCHKPLLLVTLPQTQCLHAWVIMSTYSNSNNKKITSYQGPNTKPKPQVLLRSLTFVTACEEPFV
jgi:hypothetical protein